MQQQQPEQTAMQQQHQQDMAIDGGGPTAQPSRTQLEQHLKELKQVLTSAPPTLSTLQAQIEEEIFDTTNKIAASEPLVQRILKVRPKIEGWKTTVVLAEGNLKIASDALLEAKNQLSSAERELQKLEQEALSTPETSVADPVKTFKDSMNAMINHIQVSGAGSPEQVQALCAKTETLFAEFL